MSYSSNKSSETSTAEKLTARNVKAIADLEKAAHAPKTISDRIADKITQFCGSMAFLWVHVAWFAIWIGINRGMGSQALDPFPFFILISENRQSREDERRSHLDLQINLLSEQENTEMLRMLTAISEKLGLTAHSNREVSALKEVTEPGKLAEQIEEVLDEKKIRDEPTCGASNGPKAP
ncbi:MAG: hypothetical protein QOD99_310 [Chthoniobacter sp.]|jgi:uncharacterized membrane protein|nr:hypothetical protein [Chthoniobacter sp.]